MRVWGEDIVMLVDIGVSVILLSEKFIESLLGIMIFIMKFVNIILIIVIGESILFLG